MLRIDLITGEMISVTFEVRVSRLFELDEIIREIKP